MIYNKHFIEDEVVILFSRVNLDENEIAQVERLLKSDLDWDYICKKSEKEGIGCLAYQRLTTLKLNAYVHREIMKRWENDYYVNSARNTVIIEEAKKVLQALRAKNINVITLKGIFFAENIYKNIALRPMSDMDILIKREDLKRVNTVLVSLGYVSPLNYEDSLKGCFATPSINTRVYNKNPTSDFFIHLHWHLINSSWPLDSLVNKIDMERIWSLAIPVKVNGTEVMALSPIHQLIYLSHHGFNHCFDRLILLSDILEVLWNYKDRIDWELLIEEARRFNLSHILYYSLLLASKRLRYDIPELKRIKPDKISSLEEVLFSLMLKEIGLYISTYLTYLLMEDDLSSKLKFIKRTFFPSNYVMAHSFNLPISKIKASHYYHRIANHLLHFFS